MSETKTVGAITRITLVYLAVGFIVFVIMGTLGLTMRLNQGGLINIQSEQFYQLMTLHGIGMTSAALLAVIGGFAYVLNRSVPLDPRWLWAAFVVYMVGMMFVAVATLIGGFAAAWTAMYPLPFYSLGLWGVSAAVAATAGVGLTVVGLLIYLLHVALTTSKKYGGFRKALGWRYLSSRGKDTSNTPPPSVILGTAISIPGLICVAAAFVWLIPLWLQAAGIMENFNVLFMKNFDYFFGHLFVNLSIYFAAALMFFMLPFYTKRPWKTSWISALAFNLVIILILLPYFHHLYQDFAQPLALSVLGELGTYLSTLPVILVTVFGGLEQFYRAGIRWSVVTLMLALGLWGWIFGGIGGALDGTIAINQVMHNTLWIPAHFHTYFVLGTLAFAWAFLYFLVHELSHKTDNPRNQTAAILYGFGGGGFVMMFFVSGAFSIPRRFAMYLPQWQIYAQLAVFPFIAMLAIGVIWLGYSIFSKIKLAWTQTYARNDFLPESDSP